MDLKDYAAVDMTDLVRRLGVEFTKHYGPFHTPLARPLLPVDFGKLSWEWQAEETIAIRDCCIVGFTGIWSPDFIQVQMVRDEITRAIFVPWQENPYTLLGMPGIRYVVRTSSLNGATYHHAGETRTFSFAFTGIVVEPEGQYILPGKPRDI